MSERLPREARPLTVRPALLRFRSSLRQAMTHGSVDAERVARRQAISSLVVEHLERPDTNTIGCFEDVLNGCLDLGYRSKSLAAFTFECLHRRFASRIRRRLSASGQDPDSAEVADLVSTTAEAVHTLIRGARRERHTLRYALLVSIADHRTIDFLRRKRPEYRETMDDRCSETDAAAWTLGTRRDDPEQRIVRRERVDLARQLRNAVLDVVNGLPDVERAALVLVEIDGLGYDDVAEALGLKRTDVGNVVRRARLKRDRQLMPALRSIPGLEDHMGFSEMQKHRALRLNMLRWTTEMGDGVCAGCMQRHHYLHTAANPCRIAEAPVRAAL